MSDTEAKPDPIEKTYATEWLAYINKAKVAYPQYFEGLHLTFLEEMAREEKKQRP